MKERGWHRLALHSSGANGILALLFGGFGAVAHAVDVRPEGWVQTRSQTVPPAPFQTWTSGVVSVSASTTGLTYYVDGTRGSDAGDGRTLGTAFATVRKAVTKVAAGDTVLIRGGLYREGINLNNAPSGTAAKPITFGSYGDGEVILDGSAKVTGWSQVSGSLWRAPITFTPIAIVVNDVPLKQTPDGASAVTAGSGKWFYDSAARTVLADVGNVNPNTADIVVPNNDGAQYHVFFYGDYYNFKGLTIRGSGAAGIWGYGSHVTVERSNIKFNGKSAVSFLLNGATDNAVLYTQAYHNVLLNWPRGNNGFAQSGGGWPGAVSWQGNLRPLARGNVVHMNGGEGILSYGTSGGKPSGSALFEQNVVYDNWSVNMYFDNQPNDVARNNIIFNHPPDTSTWLRTSNVWPWNELYKYNTCLMLADEQNSSDATNNYANLSGSQVYNNLLANCRVAIRDYSEGADSIRNHGLKNTLIANNTIILPASALPNTNTMGILLQDNTTPSGSNKNSNSFIQNNIIYGFADSPLLWAQSLSAVNGITLNNNVYYAGSSSVFAIGTGVANRLRTLWNRMTRDSKPGGPWDRTVDFPAWAKASGEAGSRFVDPLLRDASAFAAPFARPFDYRSARLGERSPAPMAGAMAGRPVATEARPR